MQLMLLPHAYTHTSVHAAHATPISALHTCLLTYLSTCSSCYSPPLTTSCSPAAPPSGALGPPDPLCDAPLATSSSSSSVWWKFLPPFCLLLNLFPLHPAQPCLPTLDLHRSYRVCIHRDRIPARCQCPTGGASDWQYDQSEAPPASDLSLLIWPPLPCPDENIPASLCWLTRKKFLLQLWDVKPRSSTM